jgi:hypothetical protein
MWGLNMGKLKDLTGERFGFWIVKSMGPKNINGKIQWLCQCECGTEKLVEANSLRSCNSTSCGCNHNPNLINNRFGKLLVIDQINDKNNSRRHWLCQCDCTNLVTLTTNQLKNLKFVSCKKCESQNNYSVLKIISELEVLLSNLRKISEVI